MSKQVINLSTGILKFMEETFAADKEDGVNIERIRAAKYRLLNTETSTMDSTTPLSYAEKLKCSDEFIKALHRLGAKDKDDLWN